MIHTHESATREPFGTYTGLPTSETVSARSSSTFNPINIAIFPSGTIWTEAPSYPSIYAKPGQWITFHLSTSQPGDKPHVQLQKISNPKPAKYYYLTTRGDTETVYTEWDLNALVPYEQVEIALENSQLLFEALANDYALGQIDIPEIAQQMGKHWTADKVALQLELLGAYRSIAVLQLAQTEKKAILSRLAQLRKTGEVEKLKSKERIQREVIASQRIESVIISPDDMK
jgi:hypothetical protein